MTLTDIISRVRGKLGDSAFDSSQITDAANWFIYDLYGNTRTRQMEENDQLFASAGDTTVEFPDDMQTLVAEGFVCTSPQLVRMNSIFYEYGDFMRQFPDFATQTAGQVFAWTDYGNTARFAAPLSADTTFSLDYLRRPTTMVNSTDTCELPDVYMELVVLGALERCMQTNEDYGEASQELANLEPLRTMFIRNEGRGQMKTGPTIMRSNRRTTGGTTGLRTFGDS